MANDQITRGSETIPPEQVEEVATTLHLRGSSNKSNRPKVRWQEGTIDNENMNKKKSKICCIFHPQRDFDEEECSCSCSSSSESDSDSDSNSDSDSGPDANTNKRDDTEKGKKTKKLRKIPSPNSYEKQPDYKKHNHDHKHNHKDSEIKSSNGHIIGPNSDRDE